MSSSGGAALVKGTLNSWFQSFSVRFGQFSVFSFRFWFWILSFEFWVHASPVEPPTDSPELRIFNREREPETENGKPKT
jgi:hypothetical protein